MYNAILCTDSKLGEDKPFKRKAGKKLFSSTFFIVREFVGARIPVYRVYVRVSDFVGKLIDPL